MSLPILEASLMAASAFLEEGDLLRNALGTLGSVAAVCLVIAGVSLISNRQLGRQLALWGSAASIVAHMTGALIGLVGGHGVLYGVGFPVAIVLLLRATPSGDLPIEAQKIGGRSPESHDQGVAASDQNRPQLASISPTADATACPVSSLSRA